MSDLLDMFHKEVENEKNKIIPRYRGEKQAVYDEALERAEELLSEIVERNEKKRVNDNDWQVGLYPPAPCGCRPSYWATLRNRETGYSFTEKLRWDGEWQYDNGKHISSKYEIVAWKEFEHPAPYIGESIEIVSQEDTGEDKNPVGWFLAEVTLTDDHPRKIQIEHVIMKLFENHYGMEYLYENPKLLENDRIFAVIRETGDIWLYRKDTREECGIRQDWYGYKNFETDYVNPEVLLPYVDEYVPYGEYGKVYYKYK